MATHPSFFFSVVILLVFMIISTNGLQCQICGQFNDGQGSITPCLNYTVENAHLHLKECPRKTDKFCVVSIWEPLWAFKSPTIILLSLKSTFSIITFFCMCHQKIAFCRLFGGDEEKEKVFSGVFCWAGNISSVSMWRAFKYYVIK
jgi:hypothetical protein